MIDSHSHLTMPAFEADRLDVLRRAREAGVVELLVVSSAVGDAPACARFARAVPGARAAVGVHPHEASRWSAEIEREMRDLLRDPLVAAVGEIGLDFHYDYSPRPVQEEVFRQQIRIARETRRPIVIHTREARAETLRILEEEGAGTVAGTAGPAAGAGIFHCFSEDEATAAWAVAHGFLVSFSGILTFPKAGELRAAARGVPLSSTLIETDSPFLAPVPLRGKRNEPAHVRHVAQCLAGVHGVAIEEVIRATTENYRRLFGSDPRGSLSVPESLPAA